MRKEADIAAKQTPVFNDYMRPAELADRLRLSVKTLAGWRQEGTGPEYIAVSNRAVLYPAAAVELWLEKRRRQSTSGEPIAA